ncbi:MAG: hypothetical protein AB8B96_17165 [Lysobacterales bacterium]
MAEMPVFSRTVPNRGYQWWYIDASSADGREHLVIIAFVGSVFSPFYARACKQGDADPMDYCAINAALYNSDGKRWVLTEKPIAQVHRTDQEFHLGDSNLQFVDNGLDIVINERGVPLPQKVTGKIRVRPTFSTNPAQAQIHLDPDQRHQWWPYAPHCAVEVDFDQPNWRWSGTGYFDTNQGSEPLHEGFEVWNWSRSHQQNQTRLTYNATSMNGENKRLALSIDESGDVSTQPIARSQKLARGFWGMHGDIHAESDVGNVTMLEDTPFYTRSMIQTANRVNYMHESLSLSRFRRRWVQFLLPFKTRR